MTLVLQRVTHARVEVDGAVCGAIEAGPLVLLGVAKGDSETEARELARKTLALRIFPDGAGKMNRSLLDNGGSILVVSQFTLLADTSRGNRPAFDQAAPPEEAESLYECFLNECRIAGVNTQAGRFGAHMHVHLLNDGPVTLLVRSKNLRTSL